jgi:UrcA family protein
MTRNTLMTGAVSMALLIGVSVSATPAAADPAVNGAAVDTITTVAPRITREHPAQGHGVATAVVTRQDAFVTVTDLDLTRADHVALLDDRVEEAARRLCAELAELAPFGQPRTPTCIRRAINSAQAQVRQATAQATAQARVQAAAL